eukprot:COSAG05_NODE_17229_length_329_cov_0.886957_1_plen_55_part_10
MRIFVEACVPPYRYAHCWLGTACHLHADLDNHPPSISFVHETAQLARLRFMEVSE